jgi:hypothetical protein
VVGPSPGDTTFSIPVIAMRDAVKVVFDGIRQFMNRYS